jgi:hypothetical protein
MKKRIIAILFFAIAITSCTKTAKQVTATYLLYDSSTIKIAEPVTLVVTPGSNIIYKDSLWSYNAGFYFNGINYIYLYGTGNDSIYIDYPDTAYKPLSAVLMGYKE